MGLLHQGKGGAAEAACGKKTGLARYVDTRQAERRNSSFIHKIIVKRVKLLLKFVRKEGDLCFQNLRKQSLWKKRQR